MNPTLEITRVTEGHRVTLKLKGMVDTNTANGLSAALLALDYSNLDLTIDMRDTSYITSAGLRSLLVARKKLTNDTMHVIHVNESVANVFKMTGFDSFFSLEEAGLEEEDYRLSFAAMLQKRVENGKDQTAYIYQGRDYTWDEVDRYSSVIAEDLSAQGVQVGTHVALCARNSINWIFSFFAIQKLGGIAVLINPGLTAEEVADLCEIGGASHLCYAEIPGITTFEAYSETCLRVKTYNISQSVDFDARLSERGFTQNQFRENHHADDAAVIIFSSGSTGKPKAILSSAFSLATSVMPMMEIVRYTSQDVSLAFLPFFHVFGLEMFITVALLKGYVCVIPDSKSPVELMDLIEKYQCTVFNTVPTMMLMMVQNPAFQPERLKSLRSSILGGAATTREQMLMLQKLLPNTHFGNTYGMSENACITITDYEDTVEHITRTVGKPVAGIEIEIRDSAGNKLSLGQTGEIFIRAKSMLVCYYRLDIAQQPIDDEGWLSTGDLGYLDSDGYLRLCGRTKELIICGGENIAPQEIADALTKLACVRDAKVIGMPDEIKGEVVTAAIVLKAGYEWDEIEARAELAKHLAKYKLPVYYAVVPSFPLLGSGKVDTITLKKQVKGMLNL